MNDHHHHHHHYHKQTQINVDEYRVLSATVRSNGQTTVESLQDFPPPTNVYFSLLFLGSLGWCSFMLVRWGFKTCRLILIQHRRSQLRQMTHLRVFCTRRGSILHSDIHWSPPACYNWPNWELLFFLVKRHIGFVIFSHPRRFNPDAGLWSLWTKGCWT